MDKNITEGLSEIWKNAEKLKDNKIFKFNESNTKEVIVHKVLKLLGWHIEEGEVSMEFGVKNENNNTINIDYALILEGKPKVIVECKALEKRLGENESMQVMKYAFYSEIPWAVLTNGKEWIVTNSDYKKEFFRFDISKPEKAKKDISLISKESVRTGSLQKNFHDAYTAQVVLNFLKDNKIRFTNEIHDSDMKLNKEVINRVWDNIIIEPKKQEYKPQPETGFPKQIYVIYKNQRYDAILHENGNVTYNGKKYDSPSGASKPIVAPSSGRNGWTFWLLAENGNQIRTIENKIKDEKTEGTILDNLDDDHKAITKKIKEIGKKIAANVSTNAVKHYYALTYQVENYSYGLNFACFHKRKTGFMVEIRLPFDKLSQPNSLLKGPKDPDRYKWWNGEITVGSVKSIEDIETILPALEEAYKFNMSKK